MALNTQFESWLQARLNTGLRIGPPLASWEDDFLCQGIDENLFAIDEHGQVESELLPPVTDPDGPARPYRIFSQEPGRLLRENVCQLATTARLVFERGWLRRHVTLEPGQDEHHATADQFDLLVRSPAGPIFIWVEVRRSAFELHKLIADLRACSRRGHHAQADCGFPQNHPRHEFCAANQPMCLWAVAPDGEISFEVKCDGPKVELEPLSSLPPRSRFELG